MHRSEEKRFAAVTISHKTRQMLKLYGRVLDAIDAYTRYCDRVVSLPIEASNEITEAVGAFRKVLEALIHDRINEYFINLSETKI